MLTFLKSFGERKMRDAGDSFIGFLAKVDFDAVSDAQLAELEEVFDKIAGQMAEQKKIFDKEQAEADAALKTYNSKLAEAEKIDEAIKSSTTKIETKGKLEEYLAKLLDELDTLKTTADTEQEEANEARAYFEELQAATKSASENLKLARKALADKKQKLDRLELTAEREKKKEEQAKVLAGIKKQANSIGTVLNVLDKQIEEKSDQIEKSKIKSGFLKTEKLTGSDVDPDIAAILGNKTEAPATTAPALSERLAKLKAGK